MMSRGFRTALALALLAGGAGQAQADKIKNPTAVFSGLDKITGRIISFEVSVDETVQFGALQLTPRVCYTRPQTESPNTTVFVEVDEVTLENKYRRIFTGWMFASSPGLHGIEHAVYDIWLTDCKGGSEVIAEAKETDDRPAAPTQERRRRQQAGDARSAQQQPRALRPPVASTLRPRAARRSSRSSSRAGASSRPTAAPTAASIPPAATDSSRRLAPAERAQNVGAGDDGVAWPRGPAGRRFDGVAQKLLIDAARHLDSAECAR